MSEKYLDPVYGYGKSLCTEEPNYGYVEVLKTGIGEYSYMVTLSCEGERFVFGNMKPLPPEIIIDADTSKWTNQDVVARIVKQDESHKIFCYREGEDANPCSDMVTITRNTTLYAYSMNEAGQKSSLAIKNIDHIDKGNPNIRFLFANNDGEEKQTVTIQATDSPSGIRSLHYVVRLQNGVIVQEKEVLETNEVVLPFTQENNYVIEATVFDKAGNSFSSTSKQFAVVEKDITPPSNLAVLLRLNNSSGETYTSGNWTNKNVYHEYVAEDKSGISRYECASSVNGPWTSCEKTGTDNKEINTMRWVRAIDLYNNVSDPISYTIRIDKTPPTYKVSDSGTWSNIGNRVIVEASDPNGVSVKKWKPYNGSYQTFDSSFYSTVYRNYIYLEDSLGNSRTETVYAKIDKTPPKTPIFNVEGTLAAYSCKPTINCSTPSNCTVTNHVTGRGPIRFNIGDNPGDGNESTWSDITAYALQITNQKTGAIVFPFTRYTLDEPFDWPNQIHGTTYLWEVYVYDEAGNRSISPMKVYVLYPKNVSSTCSK